MSTAACCSPSVVTLGRPWWRRAGAVVLEVIAAAGRGLGRRVHAPGRPARRLGKASAVTRLDDLDAAALRDIGLPDWMVEQTLRRGPSSIDPAWWR